VTDPATAEVMVPVLTAISELDGVACVTNPYSPVGQGLGAECPEPQGAPDLSQVPPAQQEAVKAALLATQQALSPISEDGTIAKSLITFSGNGDGSDVPTETVVEILDQVEAADAQDGIVVGANGQVLGFAGQEPPSSEAIGVLVALVILLIAFGSMIAAGLPLLTAGFGVSLGGLLLLFIARFYDVATFAPTLAAMIGLGVGIDYSLFVINRFRQSVHAGHDAKRAALESVNTSGRAVVFAAVTVVIALMGLLLMRINFFTGLAFAASGTVLLVMLSAVWLLPALLSILGHRAVQPVSALFHRGFAGSGITKVLAFVFAGIFGLLWLSIVGGAVGNPDLPVAAKVVTVLVATAIVGFALFGYRLTREHRHEREPWHPEGGRWAQYARLLQKRPIIPAILSIGVVLVLAIPALSLRLGFPDDSGRPEGSAARTAYELTAEGFGPGANGPFFVAVQLPENGDVEGFAQIVGALEQTEGVASVTPSTAMLPLYGQVLADSTITAIQVEPTTGPQDQATSELLDRIREETLPPVTEATDSVAHVGGVTAIVEDFSSVLEDAMPLFLAVVVGLGFLMLMVLFRSAVVSATAVVTSLLSFAASTGITVAVFQWGWLNDLLGVSGTGPIFPFLPVMVFAILFGLAMDYQVFLVSRMQEEWSRTKDNTVAVRRGLAGSGRVVLMAALIMFSVFAAFIPTPGNEIKLFGVALASAVLVDAFLIRLVFVPSFMSILGKANWWLPAWLADRLPHFEVEGSDEIADVDASSAPDTDPDAVGEPEPAGAR
jgi:RND superfamily putative drug exporter